jgi:hypothetical protein
MESDSIKSALSGIDKNRPERGWSDPSSSPAPACLKQQRETACAIDELRQSGILVATATAAITSASPNRN